MPAHDRQSYTLSQHPMSQRTLRPRSAGNGSAPPMSADAHFTPFSPVKRVGEHFERDGMQREPDAKNVARFPTDELEHRVDYRRDYGEAAVERTDEAADVAFLYGEQYDSYQGSEQDFHQFWSTERRGFVSFAQSGRYVLVRGGLIAPPDHQEELLEQFLEHTVARGLCVSFFNMPEHHIPLFRKHGFRINKWGEEPIVDLPSCTFKGKPFEWVRRQTNYCTRNGVKAFEVRPDELPPHIWKQLKAEIDEVAADSIADKAQLGELKFFEGHLHSHELGYRRLFIAKSDWGEGRIEGFVVCNPILGGESWATEMYRHRRDSVRGTIAFLFHHIIERMRDEGCERLYLSVLPGLRCDEKIPGDSPLIRNSFKYAAPWLSCIFDLDGVTHFKTRFRPFYERRFIFVNPRTTVGSTMAFFRVLGVFRVSPLKLARIICQRLVKCSRRKTLPKMS